MKRHSRFASTTVGDLVRLELRVMFEELLGRVAEIAPLAPPRRLRSNLIDGIKEMRVELRPA